MRILFFLLVFLSCYIRAGFTWDIKALNSKPDIKAKVNLVFCVINCSDKDEPAKTIEVFRQRLARTKPFDAFIESMGFYYINLTPKEEQLIFKNTTGFPPLKVRQDFLNNISTYFKSNYKLIIIDVTGSVFCAELSSIDKVSLIILGKLRYKGQNSFAKSFLHELGHSLGLRDECLDCAQLSPAGEPNCAATKEEAQKWWGDLAEQTERVDYINGCCGNKNYFRPTIASLMNDSDKAEDFGPVNERYLKKVLDLALR
mgnify:CR=1 FL=1